MKTNWMKRMLCLMLSAVLLLGHIPASAFAEEAVPPEETVAEEVTEAPSEPTEVTEPETSEPTEPETSEPTEPEVTEPETSAPVEETSEPTEETQPEIPEVETVEEWAVPDVEDWPSDEELFTIYAEGLLYGNMPAVFGTAAGERLTGNTKLAYDALKPYIQRIARGEVSDTSITMGYSHYGISLNGVYGDYIVDVEVPFVGTSIDSNALMHALLADMPYELYWFDKTSGMGSSYFSVNSQLQWTVYFPVSGNYAPSGATGGYTADTAKTDAAATAAANAASVVAAAANLSDYEKLVYYKEYICGAVSYDWDAYYGSMEDDGYFGTHIDSWQLIHVFDGNTSTNVVCEGYSKAFQYLCDLTDFDGDVVCYSVSGATASSSGSGGHMWNIVSIGGESYLVDVTNSDSGMVGQNGGLFLVGGTMTSGAYYFTIGSQQIAFAYDYDMESLLGSDVITLSTKAQYEPPVEEDDPCKNGHTEAVRMGKAATCTETGLTMGKYCTVCGEVTLEQTETPALGHSFADGSCTKCGLLGGTCGTNVNWTLDDEGLLTIYGSGTITSNPWIDHYASIKTVVIEEGVTEICDEAFVWCEYITDISLPQSIAAIGDSAFEGCMGLTGIELPEGITAIGESTFAGCVGLTGITIPESVTSIGKKAFAYCDGLTAIEIPAGVTSLEASTFENCDVLETVTLPEGLTIIGDKAFYYCKKLASIDLPDSLTSIGISAFDSCQKLTAIVIPEGVTEIPNSAFANCYALTEITLPDSLTEIGGNAFFNLWALKSIEIPEGVTSIGFSAFFNTGLTEITFPASAADLGSNLFMACSSLEKVTFLGDAPAFAADTFSDATVTAYYPAGNATWTADVMQNYGGTITWVKMACEHTFADGSCTKCGIYGGTCGDRLYWTVDDAGLLTIYGTGAMTDFSEGTAPWYKHRTKITKVVVESGVTSIGSYAFFSHSKLEEAELAQGITTIGSRAFKNCTKLTGIDIPEGVTRINEQAFEGCSKLAEVTLQQGLTDIESYAFSECSNLTELILPEGVTSIGIYAFQNCSSLTEVVIPEGVTSISQGVFENCSGLTKVVLPESVASIGHCAFRYCSSLTELVIPEDVTSIDSYAFAECSSLTEFVIPEGITSIEQAVFENCSSLTKVVLPESVASIGHCAFRYCSSLTELVIPEGVTSIDSYAFGECSSLTEVVLPEGISSIESITFFKCSSLTDVVIPESVTSIGTAAFSGCSSLAEVVIPEGVTSIGDRIFENCISLTKVVIPEGVTSIGERAFAGCSSLEELEIPEGVTSIGNYAFQSCSSLTELEIPEGVTSISEQVFYGCRSLEKVIFKSDAPTFACNIYLGYFENFSHVTAKVYYPEGNDTWTEDVRQDYGGDINWTMYAPLGENGYWTLDENGLLTVGGEGDMVNFDEGGAPWYRYRHLITKAVVETGVTSVGSDAFYDCYMLEEVEFWEGVTRINDYAFMDCTKLAEVTIPEGVTGTGYRAFWGCSGLTSVVIPEGVTSIDGGSFHGCINLTEVVIPESVTSIGNGAFWDCGLTSVVIPEGVASIGEAAFHSCSNLSEVVIPESVSCIGSFAFCECTSLTEVVIPEGVTSIGTAAFDSCSSLTSVVIPERVTSISDQTFYGCSSLTEVVIHEGVTSIGDVAFSYCSSLAEVTFRGDAPAIGDNAFYNVTATAYYPANNATWTSDVMQDYGGTITWMSSCAGNHAEVVDEGKPATCTETGLTEGKHCSACGEVIEAQEVIPALGHRVYFQEAVEYDPLRVENEDQIPFTLTDGTYYSANHDHSSSSELRIVAEESCSLTLNYGVSSEGGWDKLYILHNDEEKAMISGDVTDRLLTLTLAAGDIVTVRYTKDGSTSSGQDQGWVTLDYEHYSYGVGDVPADILHTDCTHDVVCTYCDTVVKKAPGHNTVIDERLEPTCKDDGLTEGSHCSVCGEVFTAQEVIPATGEHSFVDGACTGCEIPGGQCGENVYWIFEEDPDTDERTGVLTVYGQGPMYDFEHSIWEDFYPYKPYSIRKIVIEEGVTSIGNWAFGGCEKMTEVVFPEGITSIGDGAFGACRSLTEIVIPEGVTCIGEDAFSYCENLTSVVIPGSVTTIGRYAFYDCPNLQSVTLSEGLETIGERAFIDCMSLTSIEIPGTVTSIGPRVFDECRNLTEIILCEGIPAIGKGAFYGCGVTSIEIPGSVKRIGSDAFRDCENLTEVILNEGLETIDDWAFAGSGLKEIVLPESITDFSGAFIECVELEKVVLPESLTAIGEQAFLFCRSLTDIVIPENVTGIGQAAFSECSALTEILIPGSVATIGDAAFTGCTGLETLVISEGVAEISGSAFSYCSALTEVVIPESVATVGRAAFIGCSGLEKVEFRGSTTDIGENAFMNCSSLAEITFPEDITYIDSGMFQNCTSLTEIVIPEKVVLLENAAFSGCAALTKITFPGNAPAIDGDVFSGVTAVAYYPADNATWTGDKLRNYGGDITWTPIGEQPPVAQIGGKNYTSLDQALSAAKKGDTVTLMMDVADAGYVVLPAGVDLNLGEYTLEAECLLTFSGSAVMATPNAGRLIVPKGNLILSEAGTNEKGQSILPVWDPANENYVFSLFVANTGNDARGLFINEEEGTLFFQWKHQATGAINKSLMADNGSSDNDVTMLVRLQWGDEDGVAYQNYVFKDSFVQKAAGSFDYTVTLMGIDTLGIDLSTLVVTAMITTESGAEAAGQIWTIENAKVLVVEE